MQKHTSNIYRKLLHVVQRLYKHKHWIFVQDNASSQRSNLVEDFSQEILNSRFIKTHDWPPSSPDCNFLGYFFWNKVKQKVYENRLNNPFENERELKKRIKSVWKDIAFSLPEIQIAIKQFAGSVKAIKERQGQCIKMIYG